MSKATPTSTQEKRQLNTTEHTRATRIYASLLGRSTAERLALPVIWLLVSITFVLIPATRETFPTSATLSTIAGQGAVTLILALAVMLPMTAGDFDLSIASVLTLSAMTVAILNVNHHVGIFESIVAGIACGALVGVLNGCITILFDIDPFIVTLGTSTVIQGIVLYASNQATVAGIDTHLSDYVISYKIFGLPYDFYYAIIIAVAVWFTLTYLPAGRRLLYVGQNRTVSRLSGISVGRIRFGALAISGVMSGVAGVVYAGTTGSADPDSGATLLLPALAAVFLGSTTILPGRFNPWGSVIAVYFLGTGVLGLELLGASNYVQDVFFGGGLVIAVVASRMIRKRAKPA
jgi:ribose transport system permease protein